MTTRVPTRILLKQFLDDLDEERLQEFQWYLCQIEIDESRPILKSKLENATRVTTVDKLVEAFGEDGAVARTVDTLRAIKHNDLASMLEKAKADQSLEQKEEESETSSAREKPREVDPTVLEDLTCSICLSLFTDPVMLQCGHSFCQTCVQEDWEKNIVRECSLCKQFIPEGDPPINFSLKSLCENYRGRSQAEPSGHRNHTETFQTPPENIRENQEVLKNVKQLCDSSIERIKTQSFNTEKEIMDDFKMLHASLDDEEKTRRAALRNEVRPKIRLLQLISDISKNTCSLSNTIEEIGKSEACKRLTEVSKVLIIRMRRALRKLQIVSTAQINVSKHVRNLPLAVSEKMWNNRKQTSVVVDPKTASSRLSVSEHLWSSRDTSSDAASSPVSRKKESSLDDFGDEARQGLNITPISEKVDVRDSSHRSAYKPQVCPGNPEHSTSYQQILQKSPKRRRVEQDYEDGNVSVHDPDSNTSTLSHEGTSTQPPVSHCGDEAKREIARQIFLSSEDEESIPDLE